VNASVVSESDKEVPMPYLTNIGPESGPILWRRDHGDIDVLKGTGKGAPIGTATPVGFTESGIAVWDIFIRGEVVPGRWIVLGREFLLKR
jgi:hypothetical protein